MNDLVLTDPVEKEKEKKDENNEENIEDFIKKLDKVRIEYWLFIINVWYKIHIAFRIDESYKDA